MLKMGFILIFILMVLVGGSLHFIFDIKVPTVETIADETISNDTEANDLDENSLEQAELPNELIVTPDQDHLSQISTASLSETPSNQEKLTEEGDVNSDSTDIALVKDLVDLQDEYFSSSDLENLPTEVELEDPEAYASFESRQHAELVEEFQKEALSRFEELEQWTDEGQSMGMSEEELEKAEAQKAALKELLDSSEL